MPTSLTRVVRFHATHRMWVAEWGEARNREVFGGLTEPHGHDYECTVTVSGPIDAFGMIVDLSLLDRILKEEVQTPLEGARLDRDVPTFRDGRPLPTCEALATLLFTRIALRLPQGVRLDRVRVAEDPTLYAECAGLD